MKSLFHVVSACVVLWLMGGRAAAQDDPSGPREPTTEFNIVPLIGGNSDIGFGFGQLSNLSGIAPDVQPFRWSLETSAFISFKSRDGGVIVPYQDYALFLKLPNLGKHKLRLDLRAAFTDESAFTFYGIGNASPEPAESMPAEDSEFGRTHPTLLVRGRVPIFRGLYLNAGSVFTYNWLTVRPTSVLGQYAASGPASGRPFVGGFDSHAVELLELGIQYDSRDHEINTRRGHFHAAQLRLSPKVGAFMPYAYGRVTLTARYYVPLNDRITLAARLVGDTLFGDAPFYELARYEETSAVGGVNAVRGVPQGRYYGGAKLFGNVEARSDLFGFRLRGKPMKLGIATFLDAGRTWTELLERHPDLDGTGLGLKYGVGAGLRLQQGSTFVVRADLAYSPDASPVGGYFTAGQMF